MSKKVNDGYLSAKESRRISRENRKITNALEKKHKRRNVPESEYLTEMHDKNNVLEIENLHTYFFTDVGTVRSVDGITFEVPIGKTVGIVGESGCGKSVTSLSIMQLLQRPQGQIVDGEIRLNLGDKAYDVTKAPNEVMQHLRGNFVSMIFQEPMTALNPVFRIGAQVDEVIKLHDSEGLKPEEIKSRTIKLLETVGIANSEGVYKMFPHELSGGMRQRVMIAMALACDPDILIADEPTTALDVTIQAQIIELMQEMQQKNGNAIIMITHDLGVVADMADKIMVMYAGRPVEFGTAEEIFYESRHPYTWGLIRSIPEQAIEEKKPLTPIHGNPPSLMNLPEGCVFSPRCPYATDKCRKQRPERVVTESGHYSACHYSGDPEFLKNAPETSRTRKDSKKGDEA